jgi:hypothetical protein
MPSYHLSARHTSAKMFNEAGLSLSPASALLISGNHSSADTRVVRICMDHRSALAPNSELGIYAIRLFG